MTNEITKKEENGFSTLKSEELFDIEGGDASDGKPTIQPTIGPDGNPGGSVIFHK